jgi:RNA polymerase sigma factor (sigma-70 family)
MSAGQRNGFMRQLRGVILARDASGFSDAQLLEGFLHHRDEAAFAALVRRHGPMVFGVCRRVLHDLCDAEDAFQATFLVLVRKAASLGRPEQVSSWLYGVAYRTALRAKAQRALQRKFEKPLVDVPADEPVAELVWQELRPILDQELHRLPEKYRVPLVLCYLEGKSKRQAARQLGRPEGTVSTQLARGRAMLRQRLVGRGLTLSTGVLVAALSQGTASAAVPASLMSSTVQAAWKLAAGKAATSGVVAAPVATLTEGVLRAMFLTKVKVIAAAVIVVSFVALGAGSAVYQGSAEASPGMHASSAIVPFLGQKQQDDGNPKTKADRNEVTRQQLEEIVQKLNEQVKQLKREEDERRRTEDKLRQEEDKRRELEALVKQEIDQRRELLELKRYYEELARLELDRPFRDIEQAIKELKRYAGDDKNKQQAVAGFESAYHRVREQLQPKPPPANVKEKPKTGGGGGSGGGPFSGGFPKPDWDKGGSSPLSGGGFAGGGGFSGGSSSRGGFGSGTFGSSGAAGGLGGGLGTADTLRKTKDEATEKQLQDALKRIKELEDRLNQYEKKTNVDPNRDSKNPPKPVKGVVRDVSDDGLVRISIGGNDGLLKGHTLEVYRLSPSPAYLGTIRIVEVTTDESVGRPINRSRENPIQTGDLVADRLLGK